MRVLAKPELDGQVILNEFILIMENFGIPVMNEEDIELQPSEILEREKELEEEELNREEVLEEGLEELSAISDEK
jgi:hypothetical protein